jgi:hypothetical protein
MFIAAVLVSKGSKRQVSITVQSLPMKKLVRLKTVMPNCLFRASFSFLKGLFWGLSYLGTLGFKPEISKLTRGKC